MSIPVSFTGRMTDDAELRFTSAGKAIASFRVAEQDRIRNQDGTWSDGDVSFWPVSAFGDLGENIVETLKRGQLVFVTGKLKMRSYETKEGEKRTVPEVIADHVGPSLKWKPKENGSEPPFLCLTSSSPLSSASAMCRLMRLSTVRRGGM